MLLLFNFNVMVLSLITNKKLNRNLKQKANSILIVYFSCTGNIKRIVTNINSLIGRDLKEIVPLNPTQAKI